MPVATYWTLKYINGIVTQERSLADWNLCKVKLHLVGQGIDELTMTQRATNFADTPLFSALTTCELWSGRTLSGGSYSGGRRRFLGVVLEQPRSATGKAEYISYKLAGPWWYLENKTMELTYREVSGGTVASPTFVNKQTTHFVLNLDINAKRITTGEVVQECVQFAIDAGAPIQLLGNVDVPVVSMPGVNNGTASISAGIGTAIYSPTDEVNSVTIAECVRKMFRWTPDLVQWFDYSTMPYPTFRCARAAALNEVMISLMDGGANGSYSMVSETLSPRYDLQRPFVQIFFEQPNTINGQTKTRVIDQHYPDPLPTGIASFRGFTATIALFGVSISQTMQNLTTVAYPVLSPGSSGTVSFLKRHAQWLNDPSVARVDVIAVLKENGTGFTPSHPYEVTSGSVAAWMKDSNFATVQYAEETALITADVTFANGQVHKGEIFRLDLTSCTINTFGVSSPLSETTGVPQAELVPDDLAKQFYDAVNVLQWDGEFRTVQTEADLGASLGDALTFSDAAFSDARATIQSVEIDVDGGYTTIRTGPVKWLSPGEMVDLLRVTRNRLILMPQDARSAGAISGGSQLQLPDKFRSTNVAAGAGYKNVLAVSDNANGSNNQVLIYGAEPASGVNSGVHGVVIQYQEDSHIRIDYNDVDFPDLPAGTFPIKFRVWDVCPDPVTGAERQAFFLSSAAFPKAF